MVQVCISSRINYNLGSKDKMLKPSFAQIDWQNAELGLIIHYDIQAFHPEYFFWDTQTPLPPMSSFNPTSLDTDQWARAAVNAGAKYIVFVAKHCSGMTMWPTAQYDYSVASSPWKNGSGDIVKDLSESCRKYGLRFGLYCSIFFNNYLNIEQGKVPGGNTQDQERYHEIVLGMLSELWSNYGPVFEIWFDGGVTPEELGGPAVSSLKKRLQPDALVFGADRTSCTNKIHYASLNGAENGQAALPNWSTEKRGAFTPYGDPNGDEYAPAEVVTPNRSSLWAFLSGWFWREGEDQWVLKPAELLNRYYTSIGRNSNLLIGAVIDNRGLIPDADMTAFKGFGEAVAKIQKLPRDTTSGSGRCFEMLISKNRQINEVLLREEFAEGERVRQYQIEARVAGTWQTILRGEAIGHKRLLNFPTVEADMVRLSITEDIAEPLIAEFSVYYRRPLGDYPVVSRSQSGIITIEPQEGFDFYYTWDGSEPDHNSTCYTGSFTMPHSGVLKVVALPHAGTDPEFPELTMRWQTEMPLGRPFSKWQVIAADSELDEDCSKENILNTTGFWKSAVTKEPHEISVDMGENETFDSFIYVPFWRMGMVTKFEFYVGDTPDNINHLVASGEFADIEKVPTPRKVELTEEVTARYWRFRAVEHSREFGFGAVIDRIEIP